MMNILSNNSFFRVLNLLMILFLIGSCRISKLINYKKQELLVPNNKLIQIETFEQPIIKVSFQSGETGNMALDLGAGTSFVMKDNGIEHLDSLKPVLSLGKYISADNNKVKITYSKVGNIECEGFSLKNAFLPVIPNILNNPCKDISGFIGADTFEGKSLFLSFEDSKMAVYDSVPDIDGWSIVESDYQYPYFYLYFRIGNENIKLLLDTGSSSDIVLSSESYKRLQKNLNPFITNSFLVYGSSFSSASGMIVDSTYICYCKIGYLGDLPVTTPRIIVSGKIKRNTIGMQVLKRFNVILDYKSEKVYLQPNLKWDGLEKRKALREKGIYLKITNDQRIIISSLELNAIAEKIGLQIYDEILSINEIQTDQEDKCSVLEKFEAMEWKSQTNIITVKRNDKVLKFEI